MSMSYGKGVKVSAKYYPNSDYQATVDFAEAFRKDHACYKLIGNNCKTFARDAAKACKEGNQCQ